MGERMVSDEKDSRRQRRRGGRGHRSSKGQGQSLTQARSLSESVGEYQHILGTVVKALRCDESKEDLVSLVSRLSSFRLDEMAPKLDSDGLRMLVALLCLGNGQLVDHAKNGISYLLGDTSGLSGDTSVLMEDSGSIQRHDVLLTVFCSLLSEMNGMTEKMMVTYEAVEFLGTLMKPGIINLDEQDAMNSSETLSKLLESDLSPQQFESVITALGNLSSNASCNNEARRKTIPLLFKSFLERKRACSSAKYIDIIFAILKSCLSLLDPVYCAKQEQYMLELFKNPMRNIKEVSACYMVVLEKLYNIDEVFARLATLGEGIIVTSNLCTTRSTPEALHWLLKQAMMIASSNEVKENLLSILSTLNCMAAMCQRLHTGQSDSGADEEATSQWISSLLLQCLRLPGLKQGQISGIESFIECVRDKFLMPSLGLLAKFRNSKNPMLVKPLALLYSHILAAEQDGILLSALISDDECHQRSPSALTFDANVLGATLKQKSIRNLSISGYCSTIISLDRLMAEGKYNSIYSFIPIVKMYQDR